MTLSKYLDIFLESFAWMLGLVLASLILMGVVLFITGVIMIIVPQSNCTGV